MEGIRISSFWTMTSTILTSTSASCFSEQYDQASLGHVGLEREREAHRSRQELSASKKTAFCFLVLQLLPTVAQDSRQALAPPHQNPLPVTRVATAAMSTTDPRFAKLHTDPRFVRPKAAKHKLVVDERFKEFFDDSDREFLALFRWQQALWWEEGRDGS